jgi:acetyltransferase-like isoleucine patch superfamily enzyme
MSLLDSVNLYRLRRRGLLAERTVRIAHSVALHHVDRIFIGGGTEIRRNSTLDARSDDARAISIGANCRLKENVWLAAYDGKIEIGAGVLVGRNCVIFGHGGVRIEPYVMIGPNVSVLSSEHSTNVGDGIPPFQFQPEKARPVVIAEGSWIGAGSTVLGGSAIGANVVVAAGAVVRGQLESGYLYGGVPARKIRPLHDGRGEQ